MATQSNKDPFADVPADTTSDPFAQYQAAIPPGFQGVSREEFANANQPFGPWAARAAVTTIPFVGGAFGGMVGNVPGATIGGLAGRTVQNVLEQQVLGETPKTFQQNFRDVGLSGIEQGGFQALGELPGAISSRLKGFAAAKKAERVFKAGKAGQEIKAAANMRPELESALKMSQVARKAAAQNTLDAVHAAQASIGPIPSSEITNQIVDKLSQRVEEIKDTPRLRRLVHRRLNQLINESTHGALGTRNPAAAMNLDELHLANQHLRSLNSAAHAGEKLGTIKGGIKFDRDLEGAIGDVLNQVVPDYKELNSVTAGHIQDVQDISRKLGRSSRPVTQRIAQEQARRVAEARAANSVAKTYVGVHPGIPPSLYVKPGGLESMAGGTANLIANPYLGMLLQYGPRGLGALGGILGTPEK